VRSDEYNIPADACASAGNNSSCVAL